jgi:membrane protease YdiL (CAAX protease family)
VIASAIFACVHAQAQNIPALFALGIALGYNYERCGRLLPPMIMHMLFNGVMMAFYMMR